MVFICSVGIKVTLTIIILSESDTTLFFYEKLSKLLFNGLILKLLFSMEGIERKLVAMESCK